MPGCPLVIWNLEAFKEIGNALGKFLHADPKLLSGSDRRMGRILVEFDLNDGLPAEIDIDWCGNVFQQRLDYWGFHLDVQCVRRRDTCDISATGLI
jgi:hypothetical protein